MLDVRQIKFILSYNIKTIDQSDTTINMLPDPFFIEIPRVNDQFTVTKQTFDQGKQECL